MTNREKLKEYDLVPVCYCTRCYSLKIKYEEITDSDYCVECGCSDIAEASFEEWEKKYQARYGKKLTEKSNDPRTSPIFKLSLDKLKTRVYEHPLWKKIIKTLYPGFPGGLGKTDSLLLLFDRLVKDNKVDDLKLLLYNLNRQ